MLIYFRGYKNGLQEFAAFHKTDTAIEFVINQIAAYVGGIETKKTTAASKKKASIYGRAARPVDQIGYGNNVPNPFDQLGIQPPAAAPAFGIGIDDGPAVNPPPQEVPVFAAPPPQNRYYYGWDLDFKKHAQEPKQCKELTRLQEHIAITKKNRTVANAITMINLYEAYNNTIGGEESAIHTLQDIKVVE